MDNAQKWASVAIQLVDPKTIPEGWNERLRYYRQRRAAQKVQATLKARAKVWRS